MLFVPQVVITGGDLSKVYDNIITCNSAHNRRHFSQEKLWLATASRLAAKNGLGPVRYMTISVHTTSVQCYFGTLSH